MIGNFVTLKRPDYEVTGTLLCSFLTTKKAERFVVHCPPAGFLIANRESLTISPMVGLHIDDSTLTYLFEIGDKVEKINGYRYPGIVVGNFTSLTLNNVFRSHYVVEAINDYAGMLHIFTEEQLSLRLSPDR